ncbi:hypothetical protein BH10PSE13_BH10PSE13_13070 [soil metagenome]
MAGSAIITFLSGRILSMVILLTLQILIAHLLVPGEYALFALALALAAFFQTVNSFGVPRLIPRYFSQAGVTLAPATVRFLLFALTGFRIAASAAMLVLALFVARSIGFGASLAPATLAAAIAYILVSIVQVDCDAMTQALRLQRLSRASIVGEAVARLALVAAAAMLGRGRDAADILAISAATAGAASLVTLASMLRLLGRMTPCATAAPLDHAEFRALALAGWASAIAWFASSPAVIRLIAGRILDVAAFAGFAFVQGLVLSFQRYTPAMLVFPFVEAGVMRHFVRTGDRSRLENALSFVVKIDMLVIGGAIVGTAVAGGAIAGLLSGGRYGGAGIILPWVLAYILSTSIYRAFEIVSIALGATRILAGSLVISGAWLVLLLALGARMGLPALVVIPILDAGCRLALMTSRLRRFGIRHVLDVVLGIKWLLLVLACAAGGSRLGAYAGGSVQMSILCGTAAGLVYLAGMALMRPFRIGELALLGESGLRLPGIAVLGRFMTSNRA